jgi:hypothetical protein
VKELNNRGFEDIRTVRVAGLSGTCMALPSPERMPEGRCVEISAKDIPVLDVPPGRHAIDGVESSSSNRLKFVG